MISYRVLQDWPFTNGKARQMTVFSGGVRAQPRLN